MDEIRFRQWLEKNTEFKPLVIKDYISRAKRVEDAFAAIRHGFSYENEYKKDKCANLKVLVSRRGVQIDQQINLPVGTNQMDSIAAAAKKYIMFLDSVSGKTPEH